MVVAAERDIKQVSQRWQLQHSDLMIASPFAFHKRQAIEFKFMQEIQTYLDKQES